MELPFSFTTSDKCPHCGGANIVQGVTLCQPTQAGSIGLEHVRAGIFGGTEPLYADLCKSCGTVARLYVRNTNRKWNTK